MQRAHKSRQVFLAGATGDSTIKHMKFTYFTFLLNVLSPVTSYAGLLENANDFYLVRCIEKEHGKVSIKFSSIDGVKKDIFINTAGPDQLLRFSSTSLKYLKWISELTDVEKLTYSYKEHSEVGMFGLRYIKHDKEVNFGVINQNCWRTITKAISESVKLEVVIK